MLKEQNQLSVEHAGARRKATYLRPAWYRSFSGCVQEGMVEGIRGSMHTATLALLL